MLELLSQVAHTLFSIVPRMLIIRATHAGIKYRFGKHAIAMGPGLHWYWPLITEVDIRVVARQTNKLKPQVLETKDGVPVIVGAYIVLYINDIVSASAKNWDIDNTVDDIARSAVVEVVTNHSYDELRNGAVRQLTRLCRSKLKQFGVGVRRAGVTDLCKCRVYRVVGGMNDDGE